MTVRTLKRVIDAVVGIVGSLVTAPLVVVLIGIATIDTRTFGLFRQVRVGRHGKPFDIVKVRTMRDADGPQTMVTTEHDPRITRLGARLRRWKLDELPQLWNVARGNMSLVGPRPDVSGYADALRGDDAGILALRPGITGPATLVFRHEARLLADVTDPTDYNDRLIWPAKVALNRAYADHATLGDELRMIKMTLRPDVGSLVHMLDRWDTCLAGIRAVAVALDAEMDDAR